MKKLVLAGFLLAGILGANAQTNNVYTGAGSGGSYTGSNNTFTGYFSGNGGNSNLVQGNTTSGSNNSFYGNYSGTLHGGTNNSFFGYLAGDKVSVGSDNTYLGSQSGRNNNGSRNVFLGANSYFPANQLGTSLSDKLYIDNTSTNSPLIWGDFAADQLKLNGKVGIGAVTTFPINTLYANYKLFVTGGILTEEIRVALRTGSIWADYVFAKDYKLKPLSEVEAFINTNGHLPNVPSAAEVKQNGIALGDMSRIQQEKIEELTLYIIAQNKRLEALEALEAKLNNK